MSALGAFTARRVLISQNAVSVSSEPNSRSGSRWLDRASSFVLTRTWSTHLLPAALQLAMNSRADPVTRSVSSVSMVSLFCVRAIYDDHFETSSGISHSTRYP
jgi:hypothetical protein